MTSVSTHPSALQLERAQVGEGDAHVAAHVSGCEACRRTLDELASEQAQLLSRLHPDAFVRELRRRASRSSRPGYSAAERGSRLGWFGLAAATAFSVGLVFMPRDPQPRSQLTSVAAQLTAAEDGLRRKGSGSRAALIRNRAGQQAVLSGRISVVPGDELRLEFELTRPQRVCAGILADDGTWVPFFDAKFPAGVHIPASTLRVDDTRADGRVLLGSPAAVAAARSSGDVSAVQIAELVWSTRS